MLKKSQKSKSEGFTIIEVMIVLAIAGLILLIVFLAVPALQRNSRNTQRKNDVTALLGAVNEYTSNHAGKLPTDVDADILNNTKPGYFTDGSGNGAGQVELVTGAHDALGTDSSDDRVVIAAKAKCDTDGKAAVAGSARQVAVLYQLEASGGADGTCQDN